MNLFDDYTLILVFAVVGVISVCYWLATVLVAAMNMVGWR